VIAHIKRNAFDDIEGNREQIALIAPVPGLYLLSRVLHLIHCESQLTEPPMPRIKAFLLIWPLPAGPAAMPEPAKAQEAQRPFSQCLAVAQSLPGATYAKFHSR
jgi:hypothetical protein